MASRLGYCAQQIRKYCGRPLPRNAEPGVMPTPARVTKLPGIFQVVLDSVDAEIGVERGRHLGRLDPVDLRGRLGDQFPAERVPGQYLDHERVALRIAATPGSWTKRPPRPETQASA